MLCVFMPLRLHVDLHSVREFLEERDVCSCSTWCELLFPWIVNDFVSCALRSVFLNAHDEVWRSRRLKSNDSLRVHTRHFFKRIFVVRPPRTGRLRTRNLVESTCRSGDAAWIGSSGCGMSDPRHF